MKANKTKESVISPVIHDSRLSHSIVGDRINPTEKPIYAYRQNGELFSTEKDSQQKEDTFSPQSRCSDLDDILSRIKENPKIVNIPDDLMKKAIADFERGGYLDNPGELGCNGIWYN